MKPSDLYSKLIEDGLLSFDAEQSKLLNRLDQLNFDLVKRSKAWFGQKKIKGLYIRGEVGRGKTQMMDIFFQTLPVKNKKRVHFHRFMKLLHGPPFENLGEWLPSQRTTVVYAGSRKLKSWSLSIKDHSVDLHGAIRQHLPEYLTTYERYSQQPKKLEREDSTQVVSALITREGVAKHVRGTGNGKST